MAISGVDIWEAIKKDENLQSWIENDAVREVFQKHSENDIPEVLSEFFDKKVTLSNLLRAKIAYFKYTISVGLPEQTIRALSKREIRRFGGIDFVTTNIERFMANSLEVFEEMIKDVAVYLKDNDLSEAAIYGSLYLTEDNFIKIKNEKLTIGELLLSQPSVVLAARR